MAQIEILNGPDSGRTFELGPGKHAIGRSAQATVRVTMDAVSGLHLEVEVGADGAVRFKDLDSTNGTWSAGVKVSAGEWFPGTELKIGNAVLRLVDDSASAGAGSGDGEASIHRRAVAAALAGERRGGAWKLILVAVVLASAGGAYWLLNRDVREGLREPGAGEPGGAAAGARTRDLIEGFGGFEPERGEAWNLEAGLRLAQELSSADGSHRAVLNRRFSFPGGSLVFRADRSGLRAWPLVEWGSDPEGPVEGAWVASELGRAENELPLPESAEWFRLTLLLEGAGSLKNLVVEPGAATAEPQTHEGHRYLAAGGNLLLLHFDGGPLLSLRGVGGAWTPVEGGFDLTPEGGEAWLQVAGGPALLATGPFLIFSEGGPVTLAPGVTVEGSPGLLLGGDQRLWLRFTQPQRATASSESVRVELSGPVRLRWDLREALAESARLGVEIRRLASTGDHPRLLASTATLLRDWPFSDEDVERALDLRRGVIQQGRNELAALSVAATEALFFDSLDDVEQVESRAQALGASLPGTDVAFEAEQLVQVLAEARSRLRDRGRGREAEYRERLVSALGGAYPVIAAWLEAHQ